jgi:hypothetical protein
MYHNKTKWKPKGDLSMFNAIIIALASIGALNVSLLLIKLGYNTLVGFNKKTFSQKDEKEEFEVKEEEATA